MTTAQDAGKVVSLTHRPPLPPGNAPGVSVITLLNSIQDMPDSNPSAEANYGVKIVLLYFSSFT